MCDTVKITCHRSEKGFPILHLKTLIPISHREVMETRDIADGTCLQLPSFAQTYKESPKHKSNFSFLFHPRESS